MEGSKAAGMTEDMIQMLEDNVQYIAYKRTVSHNYNSCSEEIALNVPPGISLEDAHDWCRKRVHYWLQQDEQMMERNKFNRQGLK